MIRGFLFNQPTNGKIARIHVVTVDENPRSFVKILVVEDGDQGSKAEIVLTMADTKALLQGVYQLLDDAETAARPHLGGLV